MQRSRHASQGNTADRTTTAKALRRAVLATTMLITGGARRSLRWRLAEGRSAEPRDAHLESDGRLVRRRLERRRRRRPGQPGDRVLRLHALAWGRELPRSRLHHSADGTSVRMVVHAGTFRSDPDFASAQQACRKLLPNGGEPAHQMTPLEQTQYLKAAACIRSHGFPNFPDPTFEGGGVHIDHQGLDLNSPAFKSAVEDCKSLIPAACTAARARQPKQRHKRGPSSAFFQVGLSASADASVGRDDDPSVREALELVLDLNGFGVATAADGAEAIRTLAVDRPDAVILDVLMPGLDGLGTAGGCARPAIARPC